MSGLKDYELERELGRGAMGRVFLARQRSTGAVRAVKVLAADAIDPEGLDRFRREGEALARAAGEGVVRVHEAGRAGPSLYIVMELLGGGSLRERLERAGRLPWDEAARLGIALARTLARCHAAGLIHRDVKPENVLFAEDGTPRLADFGVVHDAHAERLTRTGDALGTPRYMAPEQLAGDRVSGRADVFALGVVLHELVSGERPFAGHTWPQLLFAIEHRRRRPLEGVPARLEAAIAHALDRDPGARPDAAQLALELEAALEAPATGPSRRPVVVLGAIALVAVVVALLGRDPSGKPGGKGVVDAGRSAPAPEGDSLDLARRALSEARSPGELTATKVPVRLVGELARARKERELREFAGAAPVYSLAPLREALAPVSSLSASRALLAYALLAHGDRAEALAELRTLTGFPRAIALASAIACVDSMATLIDGLQLGEAKDELREDAEKVRVRLAGLDESLRDRALEPLTMVARRLARASALERACAPMPVDESHRRELLLSCYDPVKLIELPPRFVAAMALSTEWIPGYEPQTAARAPVLERAADLETDATLVAACLVRAGQIRVANRVAHRGDAGWSGAALADAGRALAVLGGATDREWSTALRSDAIGVERDVTLATWLSERRPELLDRARAFARGARDAAAAVDAESAHDLTRRALRGVVATALASRDLAELASLVAALPAADFLRALAERELGRTSDFERTVDACLAAHALDDDAAGALAVEALRLADRGKKDEALAKVAEVERRLEETGPPALVDVVEPGRLREAIERRR